MTGSRFSWAMLGRAGLGVLLLFCLDFRTVSGRDAGSVFLELDVSITGRGADPDLAETENAEQAWHYNRRIFVFCEMSAIRETIGTGADQRRIIRFVPKPGSRPNATGRLDDSVLNRFRSFGEGSYEDYVARESWRATGQLSQELAGEESEVSFTLDQGRGTWDGTLFPETWLEALARKIPAYQGEASLTPSAGEGWQLFTNDPADRTTPEGYSISTRYHPGGSNPVLFVPNVQFLNVPAVTNGTAYSGTKSAVIPKPATAVGSWTMNLDVTWTIREDLPEVELIVTSAEYDTWRPAAAPGPQPGKPLKLAARVKSPAGQDLSNLRVERFDWKLVNTSREPGIAMNFPPGSQDTSFDLRLIGMATRNDGQEGYQVNPGGLIGTAYVEPYDWGGWTTLNVEATLNDGRVIKGKMDVGNLAFGPAENIRIPKTFSDSRVAIQWQRDNGATDLWDDEDSDKLPRGKPGADGDGLSVYEEYRGFYAGGKHISTDPRRKDLFVLNDLKGSPDAYPIVERAITRFQRISQLAVHNLASGEVSSKRLNANRAQGPARGRQDWIWLAPSSSYPRPNDGIRPGSRPGKIDRVRVPDWSANIGDAAPMFDRRGSPPAAAGLEHMVIQALFQCVSVDRPGAPDRVGSFRLIPGDPGAGIKPAFELGPEKVLVIDFFGADYAEQFAATVERGERFLSEPLEGETAAQAAARAAKQRNKLRSLRMLVGQKGGAHSGPEECLMRDWFADVYRSSLPSADGRPVYRLIDRARGAESPGVRLGSTRKGTGVNDPARLPEPRYGDSAAGAPANQQMVVSDSAP